MFDPIRTASRTANPGRGAAFAGALVALLTAAGAQAAPEKAGVSTAVKGSVSRTSTLSSGQPDEARELLTGSSVFMQDRVSAAEESRAQLMLLDESTFTLGPSSDVVIDKFIYDPETGTGELVAQATTGAFRFVSGAIGKTNAEDVTVKTPLGTMGVRGTIVTADIRRGPDGALVEALFVLSGPGIENNANARRGAILITANGRTVPVQRTGWGVRVRPGEPPSDPFPVPSQAMRRLHAQLSSSPGGGTAPGEDPTGGVVAQTGAVSLSGQTTATARADADDTETSNETNDRQRMLASGEELEDFKTTQAAEDAGLIVPSELTFLNNPLLTYGELDQLSTGSISASQTGVPLFDAGTTGTTSDFNQAVSFDGTNSLAVGSYDFSIQADFAARTFEIAFNNIDVDNTFIQNGELIDAGTIDILQSEFPEPVIELIGFGTENPGTSVNTVCSIHECIGLVALFKGSNKPIGGVLHALGLTAGNRSIVGVGATPTR